MVYMTVEAHTISFCGTSKKYLVNHSLFSQICQLTMVGPNKNIPSLAVKIVFFSECNWFKKTDFETFLLQLLTFWWFAQSLVLNFTPLQAKNHISSLEKL